jgi:hypothetical protein
LPKRRTAGVTGAQVRLDNPEDTVMSLLASRGSYGWELKALPEAECVVRCVGCLACISREAVHSRITFIRALSFCFTAFHHQSHLLPRQYRLHLTQSATTVTVVTSQATTAPHRHGGLSTPVICHWRGRGLCGFGGSARNERKPNVTDSVGIRRNNRLKRLHMRSASVHEAAASERPCVKLSETPHCLMFA